MKKNDTLRRPRVVVVGGGFAGQALARELKHSEVDIVLIDQNNFLTFQPLLYQVATAGLEPEEIAYPIRAVFQQQKNFKFRLGTVTNIDWKERAVHVADQLPVTFDYLVLAAGTTTNYFDVQGAKEHCFPLKQLSDAINLRSHILEQFEKVDQNPSLIQKGLLNFTIIGGGPTGVEMAGALMELIQKTLKKDYPDLPIEKANVILIEAGPSLLGAFNKESRDHAHSILAERGVRIVTHDRVVEVAQSAILLHSKRVIKTATPIWAVGVRVCPLADTLGLEQTRGGRIVVEPDLSIPDNPNVFIAGDMAASRDEAGQLYPQLAAVARQSAKHIAKQIEARIIDETSTVFKYKDPGMMATIGRHAAVAEFPGEIRLEGVFAWLTWLSLHLLLLVGFPNRMHVIISWVCNYFTKERTARLILDNHRFSDATLKQPKPAPKKVQVKRTSANATLKQTLDTLTMNDRNEALHRIQQLLHHAQQPQRKADPYRVS